MRLTVCLLTLTPAIALADIADDAARARMALDAFESRCAADGGALWGLSLCGGVLIYDAENQILFANKGDASGRLTEADGVWVGQVGDADPPPHANTAAQWDGEVWAVARFDDIGATAATIRLLLHESFHRIQPDLDLAYDASDTGPVDHLDEFDGRLWLRLELRAFAAALRADNGDSARAHVRDALMFRARRYSLIDGAGALERSLERHEGLAEYTGWRLAQADPYLAFAEHLKDRENAESFSRGFAYLTGPAALLSFDRIGVAWRGRLGDPDETILSLGAAAFDTLDGDAEAAAMAYGYDELAAAERLKAEQMSALRQEFQARFIDGPRLSAPLGYMTFDPQTVTAMGDNRQVYLTLGLSGPWGEIATETGGLIDWNAGRAYFDYEGAPPETDAAGLEWPTEAWTLQLNPGWRLRRDGRELAIEAIGDDS